MKFTIHVKGFTAPMELDGKDIWISSNFAGLMGYRDVAKLVIDSSDFWMIGNEYGPLCMIAARNGQDALDEMLDLGYEHFLVSPEDYTKMSEAEREELAHLGNAGEPCDLNHAWIRNPIFKPASDLLLLLAMAQAIGAGDSNLDNV